MTDTKKNLNGSVDQLAKALRNVFDEAMRTTQERMDKAMSASQESMQQAIGAAQESTNSRLDKMDNRISMKWETAWIKTLTGSTVALITIKEH